MWHVYRVEFRKTKNIRSQRQKLRAEWFIVGDANPLDEDFIVHTCVYGETGIENMWFFAGFFSLLLLRLSVDEEISL